MVPSNKSRGVKSDKSLLSILSSIRNNGPCGLAEIADETGLAKSSIHSHLVTLKDHGFVVQTDGSYKLGLRFLDYGLESRNKQNIFWASKEKVNELAQRTGERVWCMTEENLDLVYLYGASGENAVKTYERAGQQTPMHHKASGKAILAHLPDKKVEAILDHHGMEQFTENTITDRDELAEELEEIRTKGVALNLGASTIGLNCIGAPIKKANGDVLGAISIGGPANRLTHERLKGELTDLLLGITNEIELNIRHEEKE